MPRYMFVIVAILAGLVLVEPAQAYVGPGAGLSMLTAFWGLLVALFAALGFLILLPLRRLFRRRGNRVRRGPATEAGELSESGRGSQRA